MLKLHHCCQEILISQLLNIVKVLTLPGHVVLFAVYPFKNQFLGGIVIIECLGQFAQLLNGIRLIVCLYLLFGFISVWYRPLLYFFQALLNFSLGCLQRGQRQSSGSWSNGTPSCSAGS